MRVMSVRQYIDGLGSGEGQRGGQWGSVGTPTFGLSTRSDKLLTQMARVCASPGYRS